MLEASDEVKKLSSLPKDSFNFDYSKYNQDNVKYVHKLLEFINPKVIIRLRFLFY